MRLYYDDFARIPLRCPRHPEQQRIADCLSTLDTRIAADTSTGATEVTTDAGRAYIKPMGNRQGPHVLATDWVGRRRLIAMDHGLCFIRSGEDLTPKLAHIDKVQDNRVYGLFPEFREKLREDIIIVCVTWLRARRVKMTGKLDRVRRLYAIGKQDLKNLKFSTHGLMSRIETDNY